MWYSWYEPQHTIGKGTTMAWQCWGSSPLLGILVIGYGFGLKDMSEHAVLNANYLRHALHREAAAAGVSHMFVDGADADVAKHEFTLSLQPAKEAVGVSAMA